MRSEQRERSTEQNKKDDSDHAVGVGISDVAPYMAEEMCYMWSENAGLGVIANLKG